MGQYKKYDWPTLIKSFEASGLTQTKFCSDNNINAKYFSQCYKRFSHASTSSGFVEATVESSCPTGIILEYGRCRIHCSALNADLVSLIKALA